MKTILIVDDDMRHLAMLKNTLTAEGYECEVCDNGNRALSMLERRPYDVLLLDIMLPEMKGLEVVRKAKHLWPETIALVMTGHVEEHVFREIVQAGAGDFIKKPFMMDELLIRIQHAMQQEHLKVLTFTDELTGLANRRGIFAFAKQQMKLAQRSGERMFVLYADLDNFKMINDTWGHDVGDQVLVATARIFRETFRDSDIIGRIGGDEFVVMLMNARQTSIASLTERIHKHIADYNARIMGAPSLSISIGQASFNPLSPCKFDDLLRQADKNMYMEKQAKKIGQPFFALNPNGSRKLPEARLDN